MNVHSQSQDMRNHKKKSFFFKKYRNKYIKIGGVSFISFVPRINIER